MWLHPSSSVRGSYMMRRRTASRPCTSTSLMLPESKAPDIDKPGAVSSPAFSFAATPVVARLCGAPRPLHVAGVRRAMCVKLEMAATKPKSRSMGTCWATRRRSSPAPTYHYRPPGNGRVWLTRERMLTLRCDHRIANSHKSVSQSVSSRSSVPPRSSRAAPLPSVNTSTEYSLAQQHS